MWLRTSCSRSTAAARATTWGETLDRLDVRCSRSTLIKTSALQLFVEDLDHLARTSQVLPTATERTTDFPVLLCLRWIKSFFLKNILGLWLYLLPCGHNFGLTATWLTEVSHLFLQHGWQARTRISSALLGVERLQFQFILIIIFIIFIFDKHGQGSPPPSWVTRRSRVAHF